MELECYYSTFTTEQKDIELSLAEGDDLLVTADSDYHGDNMSVQMGQTNDPDPRRSRRFYDAIASTL